MLVNYTLMRESRGFLVILMSLLIFTCCFGAKKGLSVTEKIFPKTDVPMGGLQVGEKIKFRISYLGMTVGEAESEIKEIVEINGRKAYHAVLKVRSKSIVDLVYRVRDEHHSYIDTQHHHSLRYEKKINEGHYHVHEIMEYDQDEHIGYYYSKTNNSRKEMFIPKNVQDQVSCGYWFGTQELKPNSKIVIPVNADEKNWELEILTHNVEKMKIKGVGIFDAIEVEPRIKFQGFFVKRGKIKAWVSLDKRRIPLMMKVKIPVLGHITAKLCEYSPGRDKSDKN